MTRFGVGFVMRNLSAVVEAHQFDVITTREEHGFLAYAAMYYSVLLQILQAEQQLIQHADSRSLLDPKSLAIRTCASLTSQPGTLPQRTRTPGRSARPSRSSQAAG